MKHDLRVFVVDDQPLVAYTVSAVLRDEGHSAIPYTNPLLALGDARSFTPDVLISDLEMPTLGGVELAIRILALCPNCKVFLMSGNTGHIKSLDEARSKGFHFPLFEKPLSARTLVEELEAFRHDQPGLVYGNLKRVGAPRSEARNVGFVRSTTNLPRIDV
jgi:two-component system catabolic regulation response regulator CreB